MVGHIVDKLEAHFPDYPLMLATSDEPSDDPIAAYAEERGIKLFRGSLPNVALRFLMAAESLGVDYAVRITGDSLFLDTNILRLLLDVLNAGSYDLVSNRFYKSYPVGQTMEVIRVASFKEQYQRFSHPDHFEHVSQYYYEQMGKGELHMYHHANPDGPHRSISLAIDTPEDFDLAERVIQALGQQMIDCSYQEVEQLYKVHQSHATI
jgi:spore coat polysaccharide biosynthesis protein SpsF